MIYFVLGFSVCINLFLILYIYFTRVKKEDFLEEEIVDKEEFDDFFSGKDSNNSIFH